MSHQPPLNLLDLPREILTQILQPFLTILPNTSIPLLDHPEPRPRRSPSTYIDKQGLLPGSTRTSVFTDPEQVLPILLIHPIIYALSIPILYAPNHVFTLDLTGANHAHARSIFTQAATTTTSSSSSSSHTNNYTPHPDPANPVLSNWLFLRNITSVRLTLDRLRGWTRTHILPLLQRLILAGSLARLHVHLVADAARDAHSKLAPGAPLRAFIDLLADPDLRGARLTLDAAHDRAWCAFHDDRGAEQHGPGDGEVAVAWWRLPRGEVDGKGGTRM